MKILILSLDYPDKRRTVFPFVKQLVDELVRRGHHIQVVAPYSLTHNLRLIKQTEIVRLGHGVVEIYRPYYLSFSNWKIGKLCPLKWSVSGAYERGIKMIREKPDVVYGHFWQCAFGGYRYAKEHNLPLFVATGESVIGFRANTETKRNFCQYVSGVICVSSKNKQECIELGLSVAHQCIVIPNAINPEFFHVIDRNICRKELGFPQDVYIIVYVGWFDERKGVNRVVKAINTIEGTAVYSIFIGGKSQLNCPNILFKGLVQHEDLPKYLNAADVFVLPTLFEGCCNAIIEALACGLPIISSNKSFNKDVLNENNAILIDPMDIEQLAAAIISLRDDKVRRNELSRGALESAKCLDIHSRAEKVIKYISSN